MSRSVSHPIGAVVCFRDVTDFEYDDWDWFIESIADSAKEAFPSMEDADKWLDREDHAILENSFAYIGVSEQCGLASVWMVRKENDLYYAEDIAIDNLADNWIGLVENKFYKLFGEYRKIGTASNGEAFFEKIKETA